MIRRDYILRMIEEVIQALARISALRKAKQNDEAASVLELEFQRLIGSGSKAVAELSETELMARLLMSEPSYAIREKCLLLVALIEEAAAIHAAQDRLVESRVCHVKALNLLLETRLRDEEGIELPAFVPKIEALTLALKGAPIPSRTRAALMQHYERLGQFGSAEDELFAILESEADAPQVVDWGIAFFERLLRFSDSSLAAGNLPRPEVEAALAELKAKQQMNVERPQA